MRLDKFLSNLKYGSRNDIRKAAKNGHVIVNGVVIKDSSKSIDEKIDKVTFMGEEVYYKDPVILLLNKPKGYVSANRDKLHKTVMDLIEEPYTRFDLKIAGRLDIDTEGLVLLTNSGTFVHNTISPNKDVYKKYYVEVNAGLDSSLLIDKMTILDGKDNEYIPKKPKVEQITDTSFYLWIKEGKFHQVKRMVKHLDREVTYLKRVAIGEIYLPEDLEPGKYIELN